jgi:Na+/H+ antiporter NhaD/arsenite permease-like protein
MLRGVLVFAVTYVLTASRRLKVVRLDRAGAALVGAVLAIGLGAVTPAEAILAVDHATIILLFAVMGMGGFLSLDGFFDRAGRLLLARLRTKRRLVGALVWGAGLLGAIVTNDAVCVLGAPLVVHWIDRHKLPRLPLLAALATGANTGSVATLVGNPQNMLCGSLGKLAFAPFLFHMAPVALVGLAINHAILIFMFRKELDGDLPEVKSAEPTERVVTLRSGVTIAVTFGAVVLYMAGANLAFTALGAFGVLLVIHREEPAEVWARIDWSVLLFFSSLFIAVDAFARSGAAAWVFARFPLVGAQPGMMGWMRASLVFLVGSNVVTNVPFIVIVKPEMAALPDPTLAWELLAMASTFAGNLTLLGSVANIIVAEKADRVGGMRFFEYLKFGVPIALTTTIAGTIVLVLLR